MGEAGSPGMLVPSGWVRGNLLWGKHLLRCHSWGYKAFCPSLCSKATKSYIYYYKKTRSSTPPSLISHRYQGEFLTLAFHPFSIPGEPIHSMAL